MHSLPSQTELIMQTHHTIHINVQFFIFKVLVSLFVEENQHFETIQQKKVLRFNLLQSPNKNDLFKIHKIYFEKFCAEKKIILH